MTAYAVYHGMVGREITGVEIDGKSYSVERIREALNATPQPSETQTSSRTLMIFEHKHYAAFAGFRGNEHPNDPDMQAWWPALGDQALRGHLYGRIIVTERMETLRPEIINLLRDRQKCFENPVWIEL